MAANNYLRISKFYGPSVRDEKVIFFDDQDPRDLERAASEAAAAIVARGGQLDRVVAGRDSRVEAAIYRRCALNYRRVIGEPLNRSATR